MVHLRRLPVLSALFVFLASCGSAGSSSSGDSGFYIDSVSGDDAASGTDASRPWKTLSKVSAGAVPPGSTIYLKRGSVWYETLRIPASLIAVDAYGSGSLPAIDGSREVPSWTDAGGGVYYADLTLEAGAEGLGNVSEDGTLLAFAAWDGDAADTLGPAANGSFTYSGSRLYIKPDAAPAVSGKAYRASVKYYGVRAEGLSGVALRNLDLRRFSLHGASFEDCRDASVWNCIIGFGGGAAIGAGLYAGNGIEFDNDCSGVAVDHVTVCQVFDSGISPQTFKSNATLSGVAISDCVVSYCGFAGVEVSVLSNGGTAGSSISDVALSGLSVSSCGKGWSGKRYGTEGNGVRIIADAGAGTMSGVSVSTSTLEGNAASGIVLGGELGTVSLHRLRLADNADGIKVAEAAAATLKVRLTSSLLYGNSNSGFVYDSPTAAGFELYQNTFADNGIISLKVLNLLGPSRALNNVFYASPAKTHIYASSLARLSLDHNCYAECANMVGIGGSAYSSFADFRTGQSAESNGYGAADLGLGAPASGDFTLVAGSPCAARGASGLGVAQDYSGKAFAATPSCGAYQSE